MVSIAHRRRSVLGEQRKGNEHCQQAGQARKAVEGHQHSPDTTVGDRDQSRSTTTLCCGLSGFPWAVHSMMSKACGSVASRRSPGETGGMLFDHWHKPRAAAGPYVYFALSIGR